MLLSLMRKHAQSWIIKFLIAVISLFFIISFGYSFKSEEGAKVAEVNGESIGRNAYEKIYRNLVLNYQERAGNAWNDSLIKALGLKDRALEILIEDRLINQEAEKLGLSVTEDEVRRDILRSDMFSIDGRFNERAYRSYLSMIRFTAEQYEERISQDLLRTKVEQFLTSFLVPSSQEVIDNYRYSNEQVNLAFIQFSPDEYKESVQKDDELIKTFFSERTEDYRVPEKINISYIKISSNSFRSEINVSEDELKEYYNVNIQMYTQEKKAKARHILFKIPSGSSPEEKQLIRERALPVLEKAKSGEDFAELAKEYSEDTSKDQGGDIGYIAKDSMHGFKVFEDAVFSLGEGEVSDLVETSIGLHIIKVDEIKDKNVKVFTEVRDQIEDKIRSNRASDMASEKAMTLIDQMPYDIDLKEYAAENNVPFSTTGLFSRYDPVPLVRRNDKLLDSLFVFEKGDTTDVMEIDDDFYIMQVSEKKSTYLPEIEEVRVSVEADYIDYAALEKAKEEAEKYLKELGGAVDWDSLAKEKNKTVETTGFFTRRGYPPKIGAAGGLQEAAFKLDENNTYPGTIFSNEKGAFVVKWEEKKDIDEAKFNDEKEKFTESLIMKKRQDVYKSWVEGLKAKADIDRSFFEKYR